MTKSYWSERRIRKLRQFLESNRMKQMSNEDGKMNRNNITSPVSNDLNFDLLVIFPHHHSATSPAWKCSEFDYSNFIFIDEFSHHHRAELEVNKPEIQWISRNLLRSHPASFLPLFRQILFHFSRVLTVYFTVERSPIEAIIRYISS